MHKGFRVPAWMLACIQGSEYRPGCLHADGVQSTGLDACMHKGLHGSCVVLLWGLVGAWVHLACMTICDHV